MPGASRWGWAAGLLLAAMAEMARAESPTPAFREDFDGIAKLSDRWQVDGELRASRLDVPAAGVIPGVGGKGLYVDARAGAKIYTRKFAEKPDFSSCGRVSFLVNAERVDEDRPLAMEVWGYAGDRPAWRWHAVDVKREGWRKVEIPLCEFLFSPGSAVSWAEVERIAFYFRGPGSAWIDSIEFLPGDFPQASWWTAGSLRPIAFPDDREVRALSRKPFLVLTDSPELDGEGLLSALKEMEASVHRDFPMLPEAIGPVPLIVFARDREYRDFWPRLASKLGAKVRRPAEAGFTALAIATSFADPSPDRVRPVFVHEANHALMQQVTGMALDSEWFFEGLACRYQVAFSREDLGPAILRGLSDPSHRTPLADLINGKPINVKQYWQATSVVDWLLDDPGRREGLGKAIAEMRKKGQTDLRPFAEGLTGKPASALEAEWISWAKKRHDPPPTIDPGRSLGRTLPGD